jgi:glycosyltransferase involved in cell wall biosynthesis
MLFDCIVVGSHLRFDGVRQRPQHVLGRLARRVPVLVVEEPFLGLRDDDEIEQCGEISLLRPRRTDLAAAMCDPRSIAAVRAWVAGRKPLVWLYTPLGEPLAEAFSDAPLVYDRMDDLAAFALAPEGLARREASVLERAALVFAGGRSLFERVSRIGPKVRLFASGVEFEHFARAAFIAPHPLFTNLTLPVCGYTGVIDERIDFAALAALADRPVEIVLVGPVLKLENETLPRRPNVHFTGQVAYGQLPAFMAGFDVALLPFARNAATASISPTKTPEYLAAGLPVVSTPIADVVADFSEAVAFGDSPGAFAEACLASLAPDPPRRERGLILARTASWDAIVARMWNDIEGE